MHEYERRLEKAGHGDRREGDKIGAHRTRQENAPVAKSSDRRPLYLLLDTQLFATSAVHSVLLSSSIFKLTSP